MVFKHHLFGAPQCDSKVCFGQIASGNLADGALFDRTQSMICYFLTIHAQVVQEKIRFANLPISKHDWAFLG